jgi:hypothetical protein
MQSKLANIRLFLCCVCSTVSFLTHGPGNNTTAGGIDARTATQQQRACVSIRAVLSPLPAASTEQSSPIKSTSQQGAAVFRICSSQQTPNSSKTAAAGALPHVREVVLLVPLQETNTTTAAQAPASDNTTNTQNSSSNMAAPAAASQPQLLTLYAEQQLGRTTYLWTASQLVMPGTTCLTMCLWHQKSYHQLSQSLQEHSISCTHDVVYLSHVRRAR